ncbi:FecR family protein [Oceanicoccus sagamiensis]|uniref:FecR protein domain-containing protein n=1 Tax=Oceanicoccus sagamiensis TaxID=716816 RepID=A0A1X9NBK7_9GAMM|nr:FecR domain-containing protein [Oceanicoccus sagamiensis]ARN73822.1 hypothetical protein BST96_06660 [Oceanicoccus sagamiensis]
MTDSMDNNVINLEERASVQAQASAWLAKLDGGDPSEKDLQDFRHWVKQSPAHITAFEDVAKAWGDLNILAHLPVLNQQRRAHAGSTMPGGHGSAAAMVWRPLSAYWALAATVCIVLILGWQSSGLFGPANSYTTAVGEQKTVSLPDGSVLQLNTQSRVDISYSEQARAIYLHQGEAHFEVVKDPARPFDVYVATSRVRAIGTAFSVALAPAGGDIDVLVAEGVVEIEPELIAPITAEASAAPAAPATPAGKAQRLKAGEAATLNQAAVQQIETVAAAELRRRLSWQQGLLVFSGEPLQQVLVEISRYTDTRIILKSAQAGQLRIGGQFQVGDTQAIITALEQGFNLQADYVTPKLIYISYREATSRRLEKNN